MRPTADALIQIITEKFGKATLDGKRWITMRSDENAIQTPLLKFGPEMLAVIPAIVTYAAARAKAIRDADGDSALDAFLNDIVATGHDMAAKDIHAWMIGKCLEFQDERVANVSVFNAFPTWTDQHRDSILNRIKEKLTQPVPDA